MKSLFVSGSWQNRVLHFAVAAIGFGLPVLTTVWPGWQDITVGTVVYGGYTILESWLA